MSPCSSGNLKVLRKLKAIETGPIGSQVLIYTWESLSRCSCGWMPTWSKYLNIIHRSHNSFMGWYNKMFHLRASLNPSLAWDQKDIELLMENIIQHQPANCWRAGKFSLTDCWTLQEHLALGKCFHPSCKFRHECTSCAAAAASSLWVQAGAGQEKVREEGWQCIPSVGKSPNARALGSPLCKHLMIRVSGQGKEEVALHGRVSRVLGFCLGILMTLIFCI